MQNENVITAMKLQIVNFTSIEDVIQYKYKKETLKLSLRLNGTTENQTLIYLSSDSKYLGQTLGMGIDVLCFEGKAVDVSHPCDLGRFHPLFVHSDIVDYSNDGIVQSKLLRAFTFRQRVEDEDMKVMIPYDSRIFTNLQHARQPSDTNTVLILHVIECELVVVVKCVFFGGGGWGFE